MATKSSRRKTKTTRKRSRAKQRPARQPRARKTTARRRTTRRARPGVLAVPRTIAVASEEELKATLDAAIRTFNRNRQALLKKAFDEGGDALVSQLEARYDNLRQAYFTLLKQQLNKNHPLYEQLTHAAASESEQLKKSIAALERIAAIITLAASTVALLGEITRVLAV
jgi:hypothetical protein